MTVKLIHILEEHQHEIEWTMLSMNVNLFVIDTESVKNKNMIFYEELQRKCFHPKRVQ